MKNIFDDNFEIIDNLFIFKYITNLDIFSLREYYLRNLVHFRNASAKRNDDYFDIEKLITLLEFEISQRKLKKDLRIYLFEQKSSNFSKQIISNEFKDLFVNLQNVDVLDTFQNYDKIIGDISLYDINFEKKYCSISYQIDKDYSKKGLMSLFIQELFSYIEKLNGDNFDFMKQILAFVPYDNINSQKFCHRNGFVFFKELENYAEIDGIIKNHFVFVKDFEI